MAPIELAGRTTSKVWEKKKKKKALKHPGATICIGSKPRIVGTGLAGDAPPLGCSVLLQKAEGGGVCVFVVLLFKLLLPLQRGSWASSKPCKLSGG